MTSLRLTVLLLIALAAAGLAINDMGLSFMGATVATIGYAAILRGRWEGRK